jgi:DNA-binding CsgD family transcriptional regulator
VVSPALTAARVRGDVDVLSRAGLSLDDFAAEVVASVQRAVPSAGACVATLDPATLMTTRVRKFGALQGDNARDDLFAVVEYDSDEETTYRLMAPTDVRALGMHLATGGDVERSERMRRLMRPHFGFGDEARIVFRDSGRVWGGMALFRENADAAFSGEEIEFLGGLSELLARGVRAGLLARMAQDAPPALPAHGPAVVIVDAQDRITQLSVGAQARLDELDLAEHSGDRFYLMHALARAARHAVRTPGAPLAKARVRTASGMWLLLHASALATPGDGPAGSEVVVTIEEARPPEIVSLVVEAFDLTPRERDVTRLVMQGVDTKEIAAALHLSAYTVQDHLKVIFEKAGVRSRRELVSRIYFDQYVPRMGTAEIGPRGSFLA